MTINRNVIDYGQRTERTNAERLDYIIDTLDEIAERVTAIEALFHFTTPVTATDSPESVDPPLPFTNMRTINEQQIATFDTTGVLDYLAGAPAQFRAWVDDYFDRHDVDTGTYFANWNKLRQYVDMYTHGGSNSTLPITDAMQKARDLLAEEAGVTWNSVKQYTYSLSTVRYGAQGKYHVLAISPQRMKELADAAQRAYDRLQKEVRA